MSKPTRKLVQAMNIDTGNLEPTPASDVVSIRAVPDVENPFGGDGTPVIPASERMFSRGTHPTRLKSIEVLNLPAGGRWLSVRYATTKRLRYVDFDGTPKYGYVGGCYVRNERDARDPWFHSLPARDVERMLEALHDSRAPRVG